MLFPFFLSRIFAAVLFAAATVVPVVSKTPTPVVSLTQPLALTQALSQAQSLYYTGDLSKAVVIYQRALKTAPRLLDAWLNGAVILEELGKGKIAESWYEKAAAINPDPEIETALGWCDLRINRFSPAQQAFSRALSEDPKNAYALLGMAKIDIALHKLNEALAYLKRAAASDPFFTLIPLYEGKVYEKMGNISEEIASFQKAANEDSYFLEAREALGRAYLKKGAYPQALAQFQRIQISEPKNAQWTNLIKSIPQITQQGFSIQPSKFYHWLMPLFAKPLPAQDVPVLRIGVGTNPMGRPRPRSSIAFYVTTPFDVETAKGKVLAEGNANQIWVVSLNMKGWPKRKIFPRNASARSRFARRDGRRRFLTISGPPHAFIKNFHPLLIVPKDQNAMIKLESPSHLAEPGLARVLRGKIEFSVFKKLIRIVNIIDLENYTQGVLASEMPIRSPIEALKAQAVLARSEALFLKKIWRRHKKQGYDLCDGEHCQVYRGVHAESRLARRIVEETRGEVITYNGRLAHGIYSANCGGHTQSSEEVSGWGKLSYWKGIPDGGPPRSWPLSPWDLRKWLTSWPNAFCQPSANIYPSHYRWSRVVSISDLSRKISRKLHIGRLKAVIPLNRATSGNVNSVLLIGTRRRMIIRDELKIRSLLGVGTLRSTLFTLSTEYDSKNRPEFLVFHGGGWGHGVGMCQSGAMGRATAGQNYEEIIKAYFPGVEIKKLDYSSHK